MPPRPSPLPGLSVLEQTPIIIEKILLDVPESTLGWKPSSERWSVAEILAHLAHAETMYRQRTERMSREDSPALEAYDQNAAYAAGKYSGGTGRERLKTFCHERDRSLSLLRYLPEGALGRTGQHAKLGRITLGEMLHEWAYHDLGHIRQIAEVYRAAAFYPRMGNFKNFYTAKP
jgi:DinB superfamily